MGRAAHHPHVITLTFLPQEGLDNDETSALKLHFASTSKISDVLSQIKDAVQNPSRLEQGKLEVLMAKADHARLTGPDVTKLRELLNRIQAVKGLLEQAVTEKKEAQLVQALQEGRELGLSTILLEEGERTLQRIIERKNKRLLAKNQGSTPAMQAIAMASASLSSSAAPGSMSGSVVLEDLPSSAVAPKLSLIQEVLASHHFAFFCPVMFSVFHVSMMTLTRLPAGKRCSPALRSVNGVSFPPGETNRRCSGAACAGARPRVCCCGAGDESAPQCCSTVLHARTSGLTYVADCSAHIILSAHVIQVRAFLRSDAACQHQLQACVWLELPTARDVVFGHRAQPACGPHV